MVADFEILNPESLAHSLLQHDEICREDLCKLLHAAVSQLPESPGKLYSGLRKPGATADSLHYTCTQCPSVIRALNQYIAQLLPEASYNALVVLDNLKSPAHKDSLNATVPSWILPIGNFTAGFVWQEDPAASVIRTINGMPTAGALLDVASGPVQLLSAAKYHQTEPWQGDRLVVSVYTVQQANPLDSASRQQLLSLGFPLPFLTGECAERPKDDEFVALSPASTRIPLVLEVFAGSCRIAQCCRAVGLQADAVDHRPHALAVIRPILLDLTCDEGQRTLRAMLAHPDLRFVWWAPYCGTASAARSIPMPHNAHAPRPLRTEQEPDGIKGLTSSELTRVLSANCLYDLLADCILTTVKRNIAHVVENPPSSLFWKTRGWSRVKHLFQYTAFSACAYGGRRPKVTALASTDARFSIFNKGCPGPSCSDHHLPWGVTASGGFATAEESVYPMPLCQQVAQVLHNILHEPRTVRTITKCEESRDSSPRPSRLHPWCLSMPALCNSALPCRRMERLTQPFHKPSSWQGALTVLPTGAQLLRVAITVKEGSDWVVSVWGIPFTPHEFLEKAIQAGHPVNLEADVPQVLREATEENARAGHVALARKRTQTLKRWAMRSKQLESDESAFKNKLDPHVAAILKPKRLLLWREMMCELEYPGRAVFEEVVGGIPMTGEVEASGIFDPAFRPASKSVQELKESADTLSRDVLSQVRSQSKAVDETVLNKTNEEVTKGWLIGPLDPGDVPSGSVVNRRFGLQQGEKVRLIDDFRPVNATVTVRETPRPHTADVLAATALHYMRAASGQRLQGKAFDLKAAYRQLPVHPASMWTTFVAIFNHVTGRPAVCQLRALPFGAARSVYAFLRTAHSLWWLACKALAIVWSFYYDDYVSLSVDQMASNTDHAIKAFFSF